MNKKYADIAEELAKYNVKSAFIEFSDGSSIRIGERTN